MPSQDIQGIEIRDTEDNLVNTVTVTGDAADLARQMAGGPTRVTLQRSATPSTNDQALWSAIRNRTDAIGFNRYAAFINRVLCQGTNQGTPTCGPLRSRLTPGVDHDPAGDFGAPSIGDRLDDLRSRPSIYGPDAYYLLKLATQAFLLFESGIVITGDRDPATGQFVIPDPDRPGQFRAPLPGDLIPGEETRRGEPVTFDQVQGALETYLAQTVGTTSGRVLPYLKRIISALVSLESRTENLPYCEEILQRRINCPSLIELIWSYWHEEGMLAQTMNAISLRFQNKRSRAQDPLANLELDPLRPLNNLLWSFIQDEYQRLTVQRRAYEYDHHYGLTLQGKAVPVLEAADSRSKFIEAFHNLLYRATVFFQEDADTTVISDGFPLLNALKEVHLLLAEGMHNQFGELPWTARVEMLMTQWLLARPEMREFLRGRHMVPYRENWMGAVDAMKRLQGWSDVTVSHFRDLGVFGEQILLSIRYGDWIEVNDQEQARNWARYWKPEIQSYIHSYLAASGVDLAAEMTDARRAAERYLQPSVHLQHRLTSQNRRGALPSSPGVAGAMSTETFGYASLPAGAPRRMLRHNRDE